MDSCKDIHATVLKIDNYDAVKLHIKEKSDPTKDSEPVHAIMVIDNSGSMRGSKLIEAKHALDNFYENLLNDAAVKLVSNTLLIFNSYVTKEDLSGKSYPAISTIIDTIRAGVCCVHTCFV